MNELAKQNNIKASTYYMRLKSGMSEKEAATKPPKYTGEYAVYKGDHIIAIGTAEECAEELGVTIEYIKWMTTPSAKKRAESRQKKDQIITAVKLE